MFLFTTSGRPDNPGNATFHVARAARTRRTWCWMSSCSLGTLANLARLPISDVVVRSRTKLGEIVRVSDGIESFAEGGLTLMVDLNCDRDIVNEMGSFANDDVG